MFIRLSKNMHFHKSFEELFTKGQVILPTFSLNLSRNIRAVHTRENNPRLTIAVAYLRSEGNHLYEYGLHKNYQYKWFTLSTRQKSETIGFGRENCYILLSFSFQINISVNISAGLLRNLCGNLDEKFVSDQSSGRVKTKFPDLSCSRSFYGPYDPTTATSIKTSLKNTLLILSHYFAIISGRPVL